MNMYYTPFKKLNFKGNKKNIIKKIFLIVVIIFSLVVIIYCFFNIKSLYLISKYTAEVILTKKNNQNNDIADINIKNNTIFIPKIGVEAPIIWNVEYDQLKMKHNLKNGVIHLDNTALPGEIGNTFITGHSSDYFWSDGKFKQIFALLDKLVVGDQIIIKYNKQNYFYKVLNKNVVKPTDVFVLNQGKDRKLTLMTCTPVGTSLRRLIVVAELYMPNE